ncbi:TetR/AcrR family transcriptional regulator C-terminal domain-containing protein [Phytohabitans houttuyneae]|uniref:GntR family transcriptional regulator n=1 Tax=Phytohabitans houttuyneae TaxID=1076126 RepID=A0A6V8KPD9_9ACTN|nr:TetR/AcrR family transcriptional regulator C-terminal domain-containing protein [Phytohabitans houttuyneae]GFJ84079.1 GntR family transcriptional regulator [Phytohabitans houttuyneae]
MAVAPYQRIVSDVRARIADGRLAPGDRMPSTRRLAKEWGVALATATKAMALLCQEGVLEARPRSGTFVASTEPSPSAPAPAARPAAATRAPDGDLTRQRIVRAAIEIADAEGLDGLSMRGVAAKLRVATMSTYRHVASKDDLVLLMADAAFGELGYPDPQPDDWRALIERAARTLWKTFRRHPWLAQVFPLTRPMPLTGLLTHSEQMHAALRPFGLDATARLDVLVMLYSHIQGLAIHLERETQAQEASGLTDEEWMDQNAHAMEAIAASGRYPGFAGMMAEFGEAGYDLDLDKIFELGLRTLLDGLSVTLERHTPA